MTVGERGYECGTRTVDLLRLSEGFTSVGEQVGEGRACMSMLNLSKAYSFLLTDEKRRNELDLRFLLSMLCLKYRNDKLIVCQLRVE
jgi:hypothetical protein